MSWRIGAILIFISVIYKIANLFIKYCIWYRNIWVLCLKWDIDSGATISGEFFVEFDSETIIMASVNTYLVHKQNLDFIAWYCRTGSSNILNDRI